ncbi:hypothetical protein PanWU01x14_103890, partial [Parasponia andersonii]
WYVDHAHTSILNLLLDEMSINFNMFCSVMMNWIMSDVDSCLVITIKLHRSLISQNLALLVIWLTTSLHIFLEQQPETQLLHCCEQPQIAFYFSMSQDFPRLEYSSLK